MTPTAIPLRRGDSLRLRCIFGSSLEGVEIRSAIRGAGGFEAELTVHPIDPAGGQFELYAAPEVTALWPLGRIAADILLARPGHTARTAPFFLSIREEITQ